MKRKSHKIGLVPITTNGKDVRTRAAFKQAISSYGLPKSEPIFDVDIKANANAPARPNDQCLFVFRSAGPETEWHGTVESFWASALFNFLEERLEDLRFNELGEAGEYRELSDDEANRKLGDLIGAASSNCIAVPVAPTSCFVVYDDPDLKALVGADSAGFFAVIQTVEK